MAESEAVTQGRVSVAMSSRARNLTKALFDKVTYECKKTGIPLDTYDGDFILGVMLAWLDTNDAALTSDGVKRFRR